MNNTLTFEQDDFLPGKNHEDIYAENEFLLQRLKQEFGSLYDSPGEDPFLQNEFLQSVISFEEAFREPHSRISVYSKIGEPYYVNEAFLTTEGIEAEWNRLQEILFDSGLVLDSIYEKDLRKLYRFLTEELFEHEIENIAITGFYSHFCYEEFYPNEEEDLKSYTEDFINQILTQNLPREYNHLNNVVVASSGIVISGEEAYCKISQFYSDFVSIELQEFSIQSVNIEPEYARVPFNIAYKAELSDKEHTEIRGEGNITFIRKHDHYWYIHQVNFPGLFI